MNKKSQEAGVPWVIIAFAIAIIVMIVYFVFIRNYLLPSGEQLGVQIDTLSDPMCKAQGQNLKFQGKVFEDKDNDLRPDLSCDICVGADGDNNIDNDADGIPDACDSDPNNSKIGFCKDSDDKDCSKSKCCKLNSACGKGIIQNRGTKTNPSYFCKIG